MVKNKHLHYGDLMDKALHYMFNDWDELLTYRQDGRYTIDNLIAERAIRPFTVNRKNSLFYSSEEGVDVAATYLTIIETRPPSCMVLKSGIIWHMCFVR